MMPFDGKDQHMSRLCVLAFTVSEISKFQIVDFENVSGSRMTKFDKTSFDWDSKIDKSHVIHFGLSSMLQRH